MGQPAEMVHGLVDRTAKDDAEFSLPRPLSARKALVVWIALSFIGWGAIVGIMTLTLF